MTVIKPIRWTPSQWAAIRKAAKARRLHPAVWIRLLVEDALAIDASGFQPPAADTTITVGQLLEFIDHIRRQSANPQQETRKNG